MGKGLPVLVGVLTVVLLAAGAIPLQAQEEEASRTGIIERFDGEDAPCLDPTHALDGIQIVSSESVDLDAYVGQRVTVYGEVVNNPTVEGSERCPDLAVSRIESADSATAPSTTTPGSGNGSPFRGRSSGASGSAGKKSPEIEGKVMEKEPEKLDERKKEEKKKKKELPNTGGTGSASLLALAAGALLVGGGLLVRRAIR